METIFHHMYQLYVLSRGSPILVYNAVRRISIELSFIDNTLQWPALNFTQADVIFEKLYPRMYH